MDGYFEGPFEVAGSFSELFMMQMLSGVEAAWGKLERPQVKALYLVEGRRTWLATRWAGARRWGSQGLAHVLAVFEQRVTGVRLEGVRHPLDALDAGRDVFVGMFGSRFNLLFYQALLHSNWLARDWDINSAPPGSHIAFELHETVGTSGIANRTVRGVFTAASIDQMERQMPLAPPADPPGTSVFLRMDWEDFRLLVLGAVDSRCVTFPLRREIERMKEGPTVPPEDDLRLPDLASLYFADAAEGWSQADFEGAHNEWESSIAAAATHETAAHETHLQTTPVPVPPPATPLQLCSPIKAASGVSATTTAAGYTHIDAGSCEDYGCRAPATAEECLAAVDGGSPLYRAPKRSRGTDGPYSACDYKASAAQVTWREGRSAKCGEGKYPCICLCEACPGGLPCPQCGEAACECPALFAPDSHPHTTGKLKASIKEVIEQIEDDGGSSPSSASLIDASGDVESRAAPPATPLTDATVAAALALVAVGASLRLLHRSRRATPAVRVQPASPRRRRVSHCTHSYSSMRVMN